MRLRPRKRLRSTEEPENGMLLRSGKRKQPTRSIKMVDYSDEPEKWGSFHKIPIDDIQIRYYRHNILSSLARTNNVPHTDVVSLILSYCVEAFTIGQLVDVLDPIDKWCIASIVEVDQKRMVTKVHYVGWEPKYDEWIPLQSERIVAAFTHTNVELPIAAPLRESHHSNPFISRLERDGFTREESILIEWRIQFGLQHVLNAIAFKKWKSLNHSFDQTKTKHC